jgi:hypothetical protein
VLRRAIGGEANLDRSEAAMADADIDRRSGAIDDKRVAKDEIKRHVETPEPAAIDRGANCASCRSRSGSASDPGNDIYGAASAWPR